MNGSMVSLGVLLAVYALVLVLLGGLASRRSSKSPEEYFMAGRRLGTFVLFMALFGTNATTFVLVGIPARAYHDGIGVFGLNAAIIALGIPLSFYAVGVPARAMGARLGALTPAELCARRFGSRTVGVMLFGLFTLYTLPYMVQAVRGAALTLHEVAGIAPWIGGLSVLLLAVLYTSLGGMRATAWTNVLQGLLFLVFMCAALVGISRSMGGLPQAMESVRAHNAELLVVPRRGLFEPRAYVSWGLAISLTVIAFPHMLVRVMAAKDDRSLRRICQLYPLALVLLWLPAVLIGVLGAVEFPGLEREEADRILSRMVGAHMGDLWSAGMVLAVLAAVMSTLDAQLLTLSSMLVRDVRSGRRVTARAEVLAGRAFAVLLAAVVYILAEVWGQSVFEISAVAFAGYTTLFPVLLCTVRWRRCTPTGAITSMLAGTLVLVLCQCGILPLLGFLPVFWGFLAAAAGVVIGSLLTRAPDETRLREAFGSAPRTAQPPRRSGSRFPG